MTTTRPTLYSYWRSTASYRVRLALALKGIDYAQIPVNLRTGDQLEDGFGEISPQHQVPVLEIDGARIGQSVAIIDYLEATRADAPLLPADPLEAAACKSFALTIAADIHPIQNLRVLKYVGAQYGQDQSGTAEWAAHWIALGFTALERIAAQRGGPWPFGKAPGYAECFLIPQISNARRFGVKMEQFPTLLRIDEACAGHPAFEAAHPANQPDAPDKA